MFLNISDNCNLSFSIFENLDGFGLSRVFFNWDVVDGKNLQLGAIEAKIIITESLLNGLLLLFVLYLPACQQSNPLQQRGYQRRLTKFSQALWDQLA
jgi:hypothetical protein